MVISARFCEERREYPLWYAFAGELPHGKAETDMLFLDKIVARLKKRADALQEKDPAESERLFEIIKEIENERRANL